MTTTYQVMPDLKALFDSLRSASSDITVSGLFCSLERDREFDFSYPIGEWFGGEMVRRD